MGQRPPARFQQMVEGLRAFKSARRNSVPTGWPEKLVCPKCGQEAPTRDFMILGRIYSVADMLVPIAVHDTEWCTHAFAPTPAYFEWMLKREKAGKEKESEETNHG